MLNEFTLVNEQVGDYLNKLGCPILDIDVVWSRKKRVDLIGYIIDSNGKKKVTVVAEIKKRPSLESQQQLLVAAKELGALYALLVVQEEPHSWDYYWFDTETSLPLSKEPRFDSGRFLEDQTEIEKQLYKVVNSAREILYGPWETVQFLGDILLIRTYLQDTDGLDKWIVIADDYQKYMMLRVAAYKHYNLPLGDDGWIVRVSNLNRNQIVRDIGSLSPKHISLGSAFLQVIFSIMESAGRREGLFFTTEHVRKVFLGLVSSLDIKADGKLADVSAGFGTILSDLYTQQAINGVKSNGFEINKEVSILSQILFIVSGIEKVRIESVDSLLLGEEHFGQYNIVIMDPPLGMPLNNKSYLEKFRVTSKSSNARVSDLMLEQSIRLARMGGYIIALVPEITLSASGVSKEVRDIIKDETIIEAIVSLPPHILKPWTMAKVSVLVLKKKQSRDETANEVFLGKLESVEEIDELIEAFRLFRKERGLHG